MQGFDLDAYLGRIGFDGPRSPALQTLAALHQLHPCAIPFENLDPLLRRPVRLDLDTLQHKLVRSGRGGYCYEHNLLFAEALRRLGFAVTGLAARVMWGAPPGAVRPRSHMLLRVSVEGVHHVADVGFGGLTLTAPLRLTAGVEQRTPHETFRLLDVGNRLVMEAAVGDTWRALYSFTLEEQLPPDYEMANWYTSTHPDSPFLSMLMAARVVGPVRHGLLDNQLTRHEPNGVTTRQTLRSGREIAATMRDTFGVALPDVPELGPALDRLCT
jgi:N-hydroxyarylamine O-acetyltransferase